ncbi:MAG: hypothetical protein GXO65_04495, partial [Euryarchaeota archaeon]|nr:hypothetical protein [Euryarchaeota archaeon]
AEYVEMIGSTKIQDGIVRLEYVAGQAARRYMVDAIIEPARSSIGVIKEMAGEVLGDDAPFVSSLEKAMELLSSLKGDVESLGPIDQNREEHQELLVGVNTWKKALYKSAGVFSVSPQQMPDTLRRFKKEIFQDRKEANRLRRELGEEEEGAPGLFDPGTRFSLLRLPGICREIFEFWSRQRKEIDRLRKALAERAAQSMEDFEEMGGFQVLVAGTPADMEALLKMGQGLVSDDRVVFLFGTAGDRIGVLALRGKNPKVNLGPIVTEICKMLGGGGGGRPDFARGAGVKKDKLDEAMEFARRRIREELEGA